MPEPAEKPAALTESPKESAEGTIGCLIVGGIILLLMTIFLSPRAAPSAEDLKSSADARAAVAKVFSESFPLSSVELKQLGGFNLEVWISKHDFESATYLDRKSMLEAVGKGWCDRYFGWTCPTVAVRDDKTGREIGVYHCLFSYATIGSE